MILAYRLSLIAYRLSLTTTGALLNQHSADTIPDLVLLPGLDGTGQLFEPLVKALEGKANVHVVSYPAGEPLSYNELLPYVTSCFPEEKPFIILGESFSGPLAVMAAENRPQNMAGIILSASFVKNPVSNIVKKLQWVTGTPLMYLRPRSTIVRLLAGKECDPTRKKWILDNLPEIDTRVLRSRIREVLAVNVREELKKVDIPLLYLGGARDWLLGKRALDAIWICRPDVKVKILDTGHMVLQCRPEDSAAAIIEFCSGIHGSAECRVHPSSLKLRRDRECRGKE